MWLMDRTQIWNAIKENVGSILLGIGAIALLIAIAYGFSLLIGLVRPLPSTQTASQGGIGPLPLLAIGGVIVLILMLTVVAIIFSILGLTNREQAMGLPEGSIRAVIALSLIVLFAILSVFLYQGISSGGTRYTLENLSEPERAQFIRDNPNRDVAVALAVDKDGQPLRNPDGTLKSLYNVSYRGANAAASEDFAKQLLVLLGTLMTAVTSFYLGAGTATSAASRHC
jgi:hypothetical protein